MSSFFQMGHHSENLVGEKGLKLFKGLILSPVNRSPSELIGDIERFREIGELEVIFDPQFYIPRSKRGSLNTHPYFSESFETTDLSDIGYWKNLSDSIIDYCLHIGADSVIAPVFMPKIWNDDFYGLCAKVCEHIKLSAEAKGIKPYTHIFSNYADLTSPNRPQQIASIMSEAGTDYMLTLCSEVPARREMSDESELYAAMCLIKELTFTGFNVTVSGCNTEMLLYKLAGATHCSTGKFFNLRRFTRGRYLEDEAGGRNIPYWLEHKLLGYLRETDMARVLNSNSANDLLGGYQGRWGEMILRKVSENMTEADKGNKWLGDSWRHFLEWFSWAESEVDSNGLEKVSKWLREADRNWGALEDLDLLFDERQNDGSWIRVWRHCLGRFRREFTP